MLRLTRKADLAVLLLAHLVGKGGKSASARDLAGDLALPQPMAAQILKRLATADLLLSERGAHGGYSLARPAERISLGDILRAIEKPVGLTHCAPQSGVGCEHEGHCRARNPLRRVHLAMELMFERLSLAELAGSPAGKGNAR